MKRTARKKLKQTIRKCEKNKNATRVKMSRSFYIGMVCDYRNRPLKVFRLTPKDHGCYSSSLLKPNCSI